MGIRYDHFSLVIIAQYQYLKDINKVSYKKLI
ncbi:hypothetical protein Belba_2601 [Belliella baltica DSM 15883]|uniref:Uncharacterized protein n=1 Tax=Belliella baltica (strain DSM 15883 / CIP 108006 / LMG 21964 / BA134) TaxID=866536 RepID=I3Z7D0_BELBD|nr:hypothetical protein Belba_2601 [Belliella baltica DSM 15883]